MTAVLGKKGVYGSLSGRKEMSFNHWSKHEPIIRTEGTEHWSKLRCKSYKLTQMPTGNCITFCRPDPEDKWLQTWIRHKLGLSKSIAVTSRGTLAPVGDPAFNKYLNERLHNPYLVKPRPPKDSRGCDNLKRAPSSYSQRAKLGYQYWHEDHKPPSPGANVTMGAKGTFLGIGVPRL